MGARTSNPVDARDDKQREVVQERRYKRIASRYLPAWSPAPIVREFVDLLLRLALARKRRRAKMAGPTAYERQVMENLALTVRLCTYCLDMRGVWETLGKLPAVTDDYDRVTGQADVTWLVSRITMTMMLFRYASKQTPSARRRSLQRVIDAGEKLLAVVAATPEARGAFRRATAGKIGELNVAERTANGETDPGTNGWNELYLHCRRAGGEIQARNEVPVPPWTEWHVADRNRWLVDTVDGLDLTTVLRYAFGDIAGQRDKKPLIAQPGRPDRGLLPYIVRELSRTMQEAYGTPLHNVVALLASAIANLKWPLSRDDIRPYLRTRGKISARSDSKNSPGKNPQK